MLACAMMIVSALISACSKTNNEGAASSQPSSSSSGQSSESAAAEPLKDVTLKFYFGGDKPAGADAVWAAISEKYKDILHAKFEVKFIPWGDYSNKLLVMAASGDKWDLNFDAEWLGYSQMIGKNAYLPLNELLPKYAPELNAKYETSGALEAATVNGQVLSLPWTMKQNHRPFIQWRKDLADAQGFGLPHNGIKTMEELDAFLLKAKETNSDKRVFNIGFTSGYPYNIGQIMMLKYGLADLNFHGFVFDMNDPTFKIIPFEQTEAFKEAAAWAKKWVDDGIMSKDAMVDKTDVNTLFGNGQVFSQYSTHEHSSQTNNYPDKAIVTEASMLYPDKPFYNRSPLANVVGINKNSPNPERVLMFLNLLETDRELYDMVMYGVEGVNYQIKDEAATLPDGVDKDNPGNKAYLGWASQWAFWKPQFIRPTEVNPAGFWQAESDFANQPNNINNPLGGLFFDPEPIKNELAQRDTVQDEFGKPILAGLKTDIDGYIAKQQAAGLDTIIAELQKQVDAFLASKSDK